MTSRGISGPRPLRVRGLHHVALNTRDLEASTAFYAAVFGFERGRRTRFRQVLHSGPLELHLFQAPEADVAAKSRNWRHLGVQHIAFSVSGDDIERVADVVARFSVAVEGPVEDDAGRALYVRDPDGNVIELRAEA